MRALGAKGQSSFELIAIIAVLFMIFIGAFSFVQTRTYAALLDNNARNLEGVGNIIRSEIGLAQMVNGNYYGKFSLPQYVEGVNYTIELAGKTDVVPKIDELEHIVFLSKEMYGNFTKGDNIIRKGDDKIVINYVCIWGLPEVECDETHICNDRNPKTTDTCTVECKCENVTLPECGNSFIDFGEQCELNSTINNLYCPQVNSSCSGFNSLIRDNFGNCNSKCQCAADTYTQTCIKGQCGAECNQSTEAVDCNDLNGATYDFCYNNCTCGHSFTCGNDVLDAGEACDDTPFPFINSLNCSQPTYQCVDTKIQTRLDNLGDCQSSCECAYDTFSLLSCNIATCGAECESDTDCVPKFHSCNQNMTVLKIGGSCASTCACTYSSTDAPGHCISSSCTADCNEGDIVSPNPPFTCEAYGCRRP